MDKNFDNFMKLLDSKDWSLILDSIAEKTKDKSPEQATIITNTLITTTILKEYHNWIND